MSATTHRQPHELFVGYAQLEAVTCYKCGILFALPKHMLDSARASGNYRIQFYCPNGHRQGYGKSEVENQRERAEREANRAAREAARR
jgi:hypothetical protein